METGLGRLLLPEVGRVVTAHRVEAAALDMAAQEDSVATIPRILRDPAEAPTAAVLPNRFQWEAVVETRTEPVVALAVPRLQSGQTALLSLAPSQ
jgi:hypothetical protein